MASLRCSSLARVKLLEKLHFLVGNTVCRPLVTELRGEQDIFKMLFAASGDPRNVLRTLQEIDMKRKVFVAVNDASPWVAARTVVMLLLAARGEDAAATAIWCDAFLSKSHRQMFDDLLKNNVASPFFDFGDKASKRAVEAVFESWSSFSLTFEEATRRRDEAVTREGSGHGRVGVTEKWLKRGVVTHEKKTPLVNPTLFISGNFAETEGPFGAFASSAFLKEWTSLFKSFRKRLELGTVSLSLSVCDCSRPGAFLMKSEEGGYPSEFFDVIDTSNVADYVGLLNILLVMRPLLRPSGFLRTEHVLTEASTLKHLFTVEYPYDRHGFRRVLRAIGMAVKEVHAVNIDDAEKILRVDWTLTDLRLPLTVDEFRVLAAQLVERVTPLPLNADMLEDPKIAVTMSYCFPKSTIATVAEILFVARKLHKRAAFGAVDALLTSPDLLKRSLVRNLVLQLRLDLALRPSSLAILAPKLRFKRILPFDVSWFQATIEPRFPKALDASPRAGLFEPSLAVALVKNDTILARLLRYQDDNLWQQLPNGDVLNGAFAFVLAKAKASQIQLLDKLQFSRKNNFTLAFALPSKRATWTCPEIEGGLSLDEAFSYVVLLDVLTCNILSKPQKLSDFLIISR